MFHEFSDLIDELKTSDRYFQRLFEKHQGLDLRIKNIESHLEPGTPDEIERLNNQKRALKDEIYALLEATRLGRMAP